MRKLLFAVCLVFAIPSFAGVNSIYQRLVSANGFYKYPRIVISPSMVVNAYYLYLEKKIQINKGMINYVRNDDELAFVIAHELGHYKALGTKQGEFLADRYAMGFLQRAGFNPCRGLKVLAKFPEGPNHASGKDRMARFSYCKQ